MGMVYSERSEATCHDRFAHASTGAHASDRAWRRVADGGLRCVCAESDEGGKPEGAWLGAKKKPLGDEPSGFSNGAQERTRTSTELPAST